MKKKKKDNYKPKICYICSMEIYEDCQYIKTIQEDGNDEH